VDRRTREWLRLLSNALFWAAAIVLVLSLIGTIQIATSDESLPFFQDFERQNKSTAVFAILIGGFTAAGVLAGLGGILKVLLSPDS
jgi:hypothetical protein